MAAMAWLCDATWVHYGKTMGYPRLMAISCQFSWRKSWRKCGMMFETNMHVPNVPVATEEH
jgi:hypothetical protein